MMSFGSDEVELKGHGEEDEHVVQNLFGTVKKTPIQEEVAATEIAIIGFWRLNNIKIFECYNSIKVPNPMKRMIGKS